MCLQIKPATKPSDILCDAYVRLPCRMTKHILLRVRKTAHRITYVKSPLHSLTPVRGFECNRLIASVDYCRFAYSALAAFRMGMSGSAPFHRVKNC